jgi:hypothetical protein
VPWPYWAAEMSMLPRMVEMIMGVIRPRIVSNPTVVSRVDVRRFGMALLVTIGRSPPTPVFCRLFCRTLSPHRSRPVLGNVSVPDPLLGSCCMRLSCWMPAGMLLCCQA